MTSGAPPWARAEPVRTESAGAGAAGAGAAGAGAGRTGAGPAGAELARAELARAGLARAGLARAGLASAELARAELARAELARAELDTTESAGPELAGAELARAGARLSGRLTALARLVQIGAARSGPDGFSEKLLRDADDLLARAGERLRLSASHTVVTLAGGTGSGKSSLFNKLAGADFSTVGVTRPVTRDPHACVWGMTGSGPLLEWLKVPRRYRYARSSALDRGEEAMNGLVLLDLPDHDSVASGASGQVDRLIGHADLMIWVLDPQKYADAAVHRRFLVPLAGHSEVIAVVLNQSDLLGDGQVEDCAGDLRRLLDAEGLPEVQILVTSAVTGDGIDELRDLLIEAVSQRRAATARISADLDSVVAKFAPHAGQRGASGPAERLGLAGPGAQDGASTDDGPAASTGQLVDAFYAAAGVAAVGDALASARELRAVDYVGWPVAWLAERITSRNPVRKIRLGRIWEDLRGVTAGPSGGQQAEIDNVLTRLADQISPSLPKPWSQTTRAAVRSAADDIPAALGAAVGESLPTEHKIANWWRLIGAGQGLLLGGVIVGLAWIATIVIFGVLSTAANVPRLFTDVSLLPWICIMIVAFLLLGWLTASACMNLVRLAAQRERERVEAAMRSAMDAVAREMVILPARRELSEYERFLEELRIASG